MSMNETKFNQQFVNGTILEAADISATRISQNYALTRIAENGSCNLEEAQNMYEMSYRILTEGSEDLIPENLELPQDASATDDSIAAQDSAVDADVGAAGTDEDEGDLNLDDLEGIILPDSEGNQYIIQGGILVPYEEEEDDNGGDEEEPAPAPAAGGDDANPFPPKPENEEDLEESTGVISANPETITEGDANTGTDSGTQVIEESSDVNSIFSNNSLIVANLLKNTQFGK